jgi:hypothetical protein
LGLTQIRSRNAKFGTKSHTWKIEAWK